MSNNRAVKRVGAIVLALVVLAAVVVLTVRLDSGDSGSGASPAGGAIVSSTPISGAPAGSTGWRIVYRTTTAAGSPAVSSGTVYVPTTPAPSAGRFVVAWAHPTLGTGEDCTPSQATDPSAAIPGFAQMMANGWVVTSTDYTGLGTDGVLPYLIGSGEARNVIDSVRAARNLPDTGAGTTYAVWGHSQGGHASLFTADEMADYGRGLQLVGVAAAAPAAELTALVNLQWQNYVSWVIGSEVIDLWPEFYPQLSAPQVATPLAIQQSPALSAVCITSNVTALLQQFGSVLTQPFFSVNPTTVPAWFTEFQANTPQPTNAIPVYIAQGLQDDVVLPSTTALLATQWCSQGSALTVQWFPTATHFTVPTLAASDVMTWMSNVFAGESPGSTCGQSLPVTPAIAPAAP